MKTKHNKKRNTAFLYEALVLELTKSTVKNDTTRKQQIVSILKEFFAKGTILSAEMQIYNAISDTQNVDHQTAEKILSEAKKQYERLDKKLVFEQQTALIDQINKVLTKNVYNNFVPSYKNLATLAQIFNFDTPIKRRVILEQKVVEQMSNQISEQQVDKMLPIDNLVYKTFVSNFNKQYGTELHQEQQALLERYILSFADNGVEFKVFLNEEIGRVKNILEQSLTLQEIASDTNMHNSTKQVLTVIDSFKQEPISEKMIRKILKIQNLAREIQSDGN